MHFKTTVPRNHCNNISLKAFHTVTDWRCDHPGLTQSTHLFQVLTNSSLLGFFFCLFAFFAKMGPFSTDGLVVS